MLRVNYYQSAFISQKEKTKYIDRNAQNFEKWLRCGSLYI